MSSLLCRFRGRSTFGVTRALSFFFRPTPLGFRQVVQHVRLHVAAMSELAQRWPSTYEGPQK